MAEGDAIMPTAERAHQSARGVDAVHWAKNGTAPSSAFPGLGAWRDAPGGDFLKVCVLQLLIATAIWAIFWTIMSLAPIHVVLQVILVFVGFACVASVSRIWRVSRRAAEELGSQLNDRSDPSYRVRCYGTPARLQSIRSRFDDGRASGFDPVVRFARLALLKMTTVFVILVSALLLCLVVVLMSIKYWHVAIAAWIPQVSGWGAALLYAVLVAAAFPAYYRVSPGRLEVLRAGFLGRGLRVTETYDLATLYLTVDVGMRIVYFTRPFHAEPVCHQPVGWISYQAIRDPEDFAAIVLQAALSNVAAPTLPTDRLA